MFSEKGSQLYFWAGSRSASGRNHICLMYYIPSTHNYISVERYYIYTQVTLWQHVSTANGHLQANSEHFKVQ